MSQYAILKYNTIVNVVEYDTDDTFKPVTEEVPDNVGIGWKKESDGSWTMPEWLAPTP